MLPALYTIGHSARTVEQLAALLRDAGATRVVDVRAYPRSRANPQFDAEAMPQALAPYGIDYVHVVALGGRRHRGLGEASPNRWWSNASFRNYADYARTGEFHAGLEELLRLARERPSALMCSEAVWWRCHRRIITDYLLSLGAPVFHILSAGSVQPATPTPVVVADADGLLRYPPDAEADGEQGGQPRS